MNTYKSRVVKLTYIIAIAIICLFSLTIVNSIAFAEEIVEIDETKINENVSTIQSVLSTYDSDESKEILKEHGVTVLNVTEQDCISVDTDEAMPFYLKPASFTVTITESSTVENGVTFIYLTSLVKPKVNELYAGPLDYVSIEWEQNKASYYKCYGDNKITSVSDGSQYAKGVIAFNLDDHKIFGWSKPSCTVVLYNVKSDMHYATKFVHTYNTSGVESAKIGFSSSSTEGQNPVGGLTIEVTIAGKTEKWSLWADGWHDKKFS